MAESNRPSSRAEAQRLVQSIADDHRPIPEEVLSRMSDMDRRQVENAILRKDQKLGSSGLTYLAQSLYTSNARSILELLQNAEDNDYTKAQGKGEAPFVSFSVYPNQLVLECNEDGFTEENLRALCSVGQSSKTGAGGYIGEKGIGFKSVFMAAHQVHIQSGHFSFYFRHREGDSGLGMITPIWEEDVPYLGDRCTRITLDLEKGETPEEQTNRTQAIRQQFEEIHDAVLLFMKRLQRIEIKFYDQEQGSAADPVNTVTHLISRRGPRTIYKKHTSRPGHEKTHLRYYHVRKIAVTGLTKAENRIYSQLEKDSEAYARGEIVLAFPVTADSVPLLEDQWVFSFLPVYRMGFKFLVHADFVMQDDEKDIVPTSARNRELARHIAKGFVQEIVRLCAQKTLLYQWMRYLPEESELYPWDGFWKGVVEGIRKQLKQTPVFCPAIPGPPRLIENVRRLRPEHLDASGEPLLPDIDPWPYLSPRYESADLDRLRDLGLQDLDMQGIVLRVKSDLAAQISRIQTTQDEDWQSRLARLLHGLFVEDTTVNITMQWARRALCRELMESNLVPLTNGTWTSAASGFIYYSRVQGTDLDIPPGLALNIRVVDSTATADADRKRLFDVLGVKNAPLDLVRGAVFHRCSTSNPTLSESVSYLRFLYLTEPLSKEMYDLTERFRIYSHHERLEDATKTDIFVVNNDPFGAAQLLQATAPGPDAGAGAPGLEGALFAHPAYFQDPPERGADDDNTWERWLTHTCGLQAEVTWFRQTGPDTPEREMTPACIHVAKHRPEMFLSLLRVIWKRYGLHNEPRDSAVLKELGWVPVLRLGPGINLRPLNSTFLPDEEVMRVVNECLLDGEFFPWLVVKIPMGIDKATLAEWRCLGSAFGLGYDRKMLPIALAVLNCIVEANPVAENLDDPARVIEVYAYLQAKVDESTHRTSCREKIRSAFASRPSIFVPETEIHGPSWAEPQDCLWNSPIPIVTKYTLARAYTSAFPDSDDILAPLHTFFVRTLDIPNCTWKHIVAEIRHYSLGVFDDFDLDRARELYKCLFDMRLEGTPARNLKETFSREALIYGFDNKWHTASDCLWSSSIPINNKLILDNIYGDDLRDAFVSVLGVPELTVRLVYDKLAAATGQNGLVLSVDEAKETLRVFNSLLAAAGGEVLVSARVIRNPVFPVRFPSGEVRLCPGIKDFAVRDRKALSEDFAGLANFLDFDMEEVRRLQRVLGWASLGRKYLSRKVEEITCPDMKSARPISTPHRDISRHAHSLLRIAVTYNSPRTTGSISNLYNLYTLFQKSETLETDAITTDLLLTQDETDLRVSKPSASLHIQEDPNSLKIYVPADKKRQEVCFHSILPRRLCKWILTDPATQGRPLLSVWQEAVPVVQSVLNAQASATDDILSELGILEVDIDHRSVEVSADGKEEESSSSNGGQFTPGSTILPSSSVMSPEPTGAITPSVVGGEATSDDNASGRITPSPSRGAFDMATVDAALPGVSGA
ncbi:uncharacterized protein C8A04DRAFT_9676 [Dichotomopilus funicola]|uniref:Uncharacterized protein n=1 Tax=Dichotomopilus funicola TaxID=1934379 RepID=A0AAN6V8C7_9PEZI|nr:hypothetical protein C8A04DRAFT_9676 [Dichotomopilus funicola]